ncbi:MAG: hypothetical protein WCH34_00665 [Bacteroidota bacterium]
MSYKTKSVLLWVVAVVFTLLFLVYQRWTGPTYPVSGHFQYANTEVKYKLLRTSDAAADQEVKVMAPGNVIKGKFEFRRFHSNDTLSTVEMMRSGDTLIGMVPHQAPAGKVSYQIKLYTDADPNGMYIKPEPTVIRFKGPVPIWVLLPHIILIFGAFLFSTRTGLSAMVKGKNTFAYSVVTLICLTIAGGILGPVMQKYAFGAFWTGWPFGHDLTDNKTAVAMLFWIIAIVKMWKNRENKKWAIIASVVLILVYLIPHSVLGSEIDYTATQTPKTVSQLVF